MMIRALLLAFCCGLSAAQHVVDDTGWPDTKVLLVRDFSSEDDLLKAIDKGKNGLLASRHVFVGLYAPECKADLEAKWFVWGAARSTDPILLSLVRLELSKAPRLVEAVKIPKDVCKTALYIPKDGDLSDLQAFPAHQDLRSNFMKWAGQRLAIPVTFRNVGNSDVAVYYLGENGAGINKKYPVADLAPGSLKSINSYVSHVFYVLDAKTDELLEWFSLDKGGLRDVGTWLEACGDDKARECPNRAVEALRFAYGVWYRQRMALNVLQPTHVERFTSVGFEKHRLPAEIYEPLRDFYLKHQAELVDEHLVGPAINQLDVATQVMTYPVDAKERLFEGVRPMLERWSNRTLQGTSCYGIRRYNEGNRLLMHVDTMETHAVSGIINVAQNLSQPWPLYIMDHGGHLHKVVMEPGDIVFYESASALHGRPEPLKGESYYNIFIHYKPEDWTPIPLL